MNARILRTLVLLGCALSGHGADRHSVLLDDKFVESPQQRLTWTCPEGVPEHLKQAATKLFALGYADPRGLEYKSATIFNPWKAISVHAWLFTGANGHRYAVAWNGMVYAVETESGPADLERDVAALIERDDRTLAAERARHLKEVEAWEKKEKRSYPFSQTSWSRIFPPEHGYSHEELRSNMPIMLLRFGRTDLAVKLWTRWFNVAEKDLDLEAKASDELVREWLGAWKDRAGCAHANRDDKLALASMRFIEQTFETTGVPRFRGAKVPFGHEELLADQERRLREHDAKGIPVGDWKSVEKLPVEQRATEWIRWLDDSDEKTTAEIERRVLELGQVALEPVLVEFVRDQRLMRAEHIYAFRSPPPHTIDFVPVWEILRDLASKLAGLPHGTLSAKEWAMRNAQVADADVRKELAAFLRREAPQNKDASLTDIAWRHLNDNDDPVLWAPAAETLCRAGNGSYLDDPEPQTERTRKEAKSLYMGLFGAKYRQQTKPSVGELMLRRAEELEKKEMRQEARDVRETKNIWGD